MGVLLLAWLGASKELIIGGSRCGSDVEINMVCSNQILGVMFASSNKIANKETHRLNRFCIQSLRH